MNPYTSRLNEQYARIGKALSSPRRIELLELLSQTPRSVEELANLTGMGIANTSQHLQHLRQAHLIEADKQGFYVFYRIADPQVQGFLNQLSELAASQLAEVQQIETEFVKQAEQWVSVGFNELQTHMQQGALLLDVRPQREYQSGHIPGAISVPLPELAHYITQLPKAQSLVAYCRGPYCLFALDAVKQLSQHGFQTFHLREGMTGWLRHSQAKAV